MTGPVSHSPPPIAAPAMNSPGPSMDTQFRILKAGGWGNWPTRQAGMRFEPGVEAVEAPIVEPTLPLTVTCISVRSGTVHL